jgi:hypothetical protein
MPPGSRTGRRHALRQPRQTRSRGSRQGRRGRRSRPGWGRPKWRGRSCSSCPSGVNPYVGGATMMLYAGSVTAWLAMPPHRSHGGRSWLAGCGSPVGALLLVVGAISAETAPEIPVPRMRGGKQWSSAHIPALEPDPEITGAAEFGPSDDVLSRRGDPSGDYHEQTIGPGQDRRRSSWPKAWERTALR